jgi:hypothetical protein
MPGKFPAAAAVLFILAAVPALAAPDATDSCSLLSQSQVSTAVGAQMGAGTWISPSFKTTCTWTAPGVIVTLMTESTDMYQAGKKPVAPGYQIVPVSGLGDDAYFVVVSTQATLFTLKGSIAFKTSVYNSKISADTKEAMEKALAAQVASEL